MTYRLPLVLSFMLIGSYALAQTAYLKAGPQLATLAGNQRADNGQYLSFLAGLGFESPIQSLDQIEFTAELNFSRLGFQSELIDNSEIRLNYVNVPLLIRRSFGTTGLYAGTGFGYGLLLRAAAVGGGLKALINEEYRSTDLFVPISVGYYLSDGWSVDLRYHLGINDITVNELNESYNRSLQLTLHYFL